MIRWVLVGGIECGNIGMSWLESVGEIAIGFANEFEYYPFLSRHFDMLELGIARQLTHQTYEVKQMRPLSKTQHASRTTDS